MLDGLRTRFQELISRTDVDEQEIQDFIEDHKSIIDPNAKRILSKESLGERNQADFILIYTDGVRVVELKRPQDRIFSRRMRLSSTTRLALSELTRYQAWIESNRSLAIGRYGSAALRKGWAIVGRTRQMNENELQNLTAWNSTNDSIEIKTFDDLLRNFDVRIRQIEAL